MLDWGAKKLVAKFDPRINPNGKTINPPTLLKDFNRNISYAEKQKLVDKALKIAQNTGGFELTENR